MNTLKQYFNLILNFITNGVWNLQLKDLTGSKHFFIRQLRIYILAIKGFYEDKCQLRASALTFYSLLSVVPVLAMGFGIAKGFNLDRYLEKILISKFSEQKEVLNWLIQFANNMLKNTEGGLIAGLGFIILFWSVIKVLSNIEESFNGVWQIKKNRSITRKFSDYTAIMIFGPILLITSSGGTVFVETMMNKFIEGNSLLEYVGPVLFYIIKLAPFVLMWILFTLLYVFMPNTHVQFKSAFVAGVVAGTIFQIFQVLYIEFQGMVTSYNAIYGSFAALPLFLIWLQLSWLVVLFGAEISFAEQNVEGYEYKAATSKISYDYRRLLHLYIIQTIVINFKNNAKPLCSYNISHKLEIPIYLVKSILFDLHDANLISELLTDKDKEIAYQPAFDINEMTIKKIIDTLETKGSNNIPISETVNYDSIKEIMDNYREGINNTKLSTLIHNI